MSDEAGTSPKWEHTSAFLEERNAYLEYLTSFQDEMAKIIRIYTSNITFSSERCLQEIVSFIARKFDLYMVCVLLADEATSELTPFVCAGEESLAQQIMGSRIPFGSGLIGHTAKTGETIRVNEVSQDPRFVRGPFELTQCEVCVPIRIKHRIAGVLDLQDSVRNRFRRDFVRLMEDIALNIGFALETRQLHDDLKRSNEELEKKVEAKVAELKKSEERYRGIVENTTTPIFMADVEGRFVWINRAASTLLGYRREEIVALPVERIARDGHTDILRAAILQALEGREVRPTRMELRTRSGEERTVEFACVAVHENGRPAGIEGTLQDITDRVVIDKLRKNYTKSLEDAVVERTGEIKETQRASILAIANLAESIDDDTGGHLERIRHYSKILAEDLRANTHHASEITAEYCELVFDLSPLHDLGKVGIRDYILQKPDKLTTEEFEKMKDHAEIGARALRMAGEMIHRESIFSMAEMIARYHHEKWDGTGYPAVPINGEVRPLRGEEIPLCARLVALADVYDALTSKRPYKMPFPHERARDMIMAQSGRHFDPEVVQSFVRCEQEFVRIRSLYPDTHIPDGRPFELPARDRA